MSFIVILTWLLFILFHCSEQLGRGRHGKRRVGCGAGEMCPVFLTDQTDRAVEAEERAGILDLGRSDVITPAPKKTGFKTLIYSKIYLFNLVHNTTVVPVLGKLYLQDLSIKNRVIYKGDIGWIG
ncbi:uncharacterized protein LOC143694344 [Agelaius phoeniceus]|uniref:uncharacterized protein LOC143694344 n=1 Tax=Agelaius phoeniceus TaxID=39638 RepID=UPI004054D6FA